MKQAPFVQLHLVKLGNKGFTMVSEYNKRQLNLMLEKILMYRKNSIELLYLIGDLEALLEVLEDIDLSWKEEFRSIWWDLEYRYAIAIDENKQVLSVDEESEILGALNELEGHINQLLIERG